MTYVTILESLAALNEDALLATGFEDALIGYTLNYHHSHVAVYDLDACIAVLIHRDGMTEDDAEEYLSYNTLDAYFGENGPIFIRMFNDPEA